MIKYKYKRWLAVIVLLPLLFIFLKVGTAQIQSIANYLLKKDVVDMGGASSQSANYKLNDAIGQAGGIGATSGSNYRESSGLLSGGAAPTTLAPVYPSAAATQTIGSEFWVDIVVGDNANPVSNLFGVSFDLEFTNTTYLDVVTPYGSNVIPGDFIVSDVVFIQTVDEAAGKVSIGISRKSGHGGVDGFGTVARVKFISASGTPDGTDVVFSLSNVKANDPSGTDITLSPGSLSVTLTGGIIVWPGDTNNNKVVDQADILPLGLFWGSTGTPRVGASIAWTGQPASPWTPENATYADATGDGTVDQADVLPIGLHWGKTHTLLSTSGEKLTAQDLETSNAATMRINLTGDTQPNGVCRVEFVAENVTGLFGISFKMVYSPTTYIDSIKAEDGSWLGEDIIFYPTVNMNAGNVSFGISRKAGQGGISGNGVIATIRMRMKDISFVETNLTLQNVTANDHQGNSIQFDVVNCTITAVEKLKAETIPNSYELHQNYPNPFNPETTIQFGVMQPCRVVLKVFDVTGREVAQLANEIYQAGPHQVKFDAHGLASGIYFYQIQMANFQAVRKMILLE